MQITTLHLDRLSAYIPFVVQCTDATGLKTSPTVDKLIIYEEDGADDTEIVAADEIANSPFDPVQLPTDAGKTGLWGVLIAKSNFTAGKHYIALWEMTVDGVATAKVEMYFFVNSSDTLLKYLNGKRKYNIATVAVPARNVEVGMVESRDMWISATQKLHIEYTYNTNKDVTDLNFTVV